MEKKGPPEARFRHEEFRIGMGPACQERAPLCGIDHGAALEVHGAHVGEQSVPGRGQEQRQQVGEAV
jgi:hypothetical protein